MKRFTLTLAGAVLLSVLTAILVFGRDNYDVNREFPAKSSVKINTISGNCIIKRGNSDKILVEIDATYRPRDNFEPAIEEDGDRLIISEEMYGSTHGECTWTITVPEKTKISFSTASGNFEAADLDSRISVNTASGNITVDNCKGELKGSTASGEVSLKGLSGDIQATTASGDVSLENLSGIIEVSAASGNIKARALKGELNLSVASGNITASEIYPEEACDFGTASGDVSVILAGGPKDDLKVSSASGNAVLDYNGMPMKGHFKLTACVDPHPGRIKAPFKFDKEEEFTRGDQDYVTKSFTKDNRSPEITIETSSGDAVLEE